MIILGQYISNQFVYLEYEVLVNWCECVLDTSYLYHYVKYYHFMGYEQLEKLAIRVIDIVNSISRVLGYAINCDYVGLKPYG